MNTSEKLTKADAVNSLFITAGYIAATIRAIQPLLDQNVAHRLWQAEAAFRLAASDLELEESKK